ncbi:MAG: hydroxymethylbilane synthase [Helicobacteraceae bacterium]|jgi:hydroxymethylbilane synthase|nr:hydroxymethylbilane synthase [Helicobacteraceae bacterium]
MSKIIIASRGSRLALWQSEHIASRLMAAHEGLETEIKVFKTQGDIILDTPLAKIGGKGLFTKELEDAILRGEAHIAVHSLKDVPVELPSGLILAGVTARADRRDALVSDKYSGLDSLPRGAVVGTTSLRRRMQLLAIRPDLIIKNLRGNLQSRFEKLKNGLFDAIILAYAGLERLNMMREAKYVAPFETDIIVPAMGQGILAVECSSGEDNLLAMLSPLFDEIADIESKIERRFVERLQGGCQAPIGVSAEVFTGGTIYARGVVGLPNGKNILSAEVRGGVSMANELGEALAEKLIALGAKETIARAEIMANGLSDE